MRVNARYSDPCCYLNFLRDETSYCYFSSFSPSFRHSLSNKLMASAVFASNCHRLGPPSSFHTPNCSKYVRLSTASTDFGQRSQVTFLRAHTAFLSVASFGNAHAHFLIRTKPLARQFSQFHAAGEENWKWNAIRSFFVRFH